MLSQKGLFGIVSKSRVLPRLVSQRSCAGIFQSRGFRIYRKEEYPQDISASPKDVPNSPEFDKDYNDFLHDAENLTNEQWIEKYKPIFEKQRQIIASENLTLESYANDLLQLPIFEKIPEVAENIKQYVAEFNESIRRLEEIREKNRKAVESPAPNWEALLKASPENEAFIETSREKYETHLLHSYQYLPVFNVDKFMADLVKSRLPMLKEWKQQYDELLPTALQVEDQLKELDYQIENLSEITVDEVLDKHPEWREIIRKNVIEENWGAFFEQEPQTFDVNEIDPDLRGRYEAKIKELEEELQEAEKVQ